MAILVLKCFTWVGKLSPWLGPVAPSASKPLCPPGWELVSFQFFFSNFALFVLLGAPPGGRRGFVGSQLWCQDEQLRLQWFPCCRELLRHRQDLAFQLLMFQGLLLQIPIYKVQFSKFLYAKAKYFWNSYLEPTTCQPPLDEKTADLKPNKTWPKAKTNVQDHPYSPWYEKTAGTKAWGTRAFR